MNETQVPLDRSNYRLFSGLLTIEIPVSLLKEDSMNTVSLLSEKKYPISTRYRMPDMLPMWAYPEGLGIEEPWYGDENYTDYTYPDAPRSGNGAIINQHSGWLFFSVGS